MVPAPVPPGPRPLPEAVGSAEPASPAPGYVFICTDATQAEFESRGLFGAALQELGQMQRTIGRETQLFLFNCDSCRLSGRFCPVGRPERDILVQAFGKVYPAQVRVQPMDLNVMEVILDGNLGGGPKSPLEVDALKDRLRQGVPVPMQAPIMPLARAQAAPEALPMKRKATMASPAAADNTACWNFQRGSCPRGASCRYLHAAGGAAQPRAALAPPPATTSPGYVFHCSSATEADCRALGLFGSPDRELAVMQASIGAGCELLLLNIETQQLMGPFIAAGAVGRALLPGAFNGKFTAQVRVVAAGASVLQAQLPGRVPSGPTTAAQLRELKLALALGKAEPADDWCTATGSPFEPPAKRARWQAAGWQVPFRCTPQWGRMQMVKLEQFVDGRRAWEGDPARDPNSFVCWDYVAGSCPRGERCRYRHFDGNAAGYLFVCSSATQADCETHQLFGSPERELEQMQQYIREGTQLFLLNFETLTLIGAFIASAAPESRVVPGAFGGKFTAHVKVAPLDWPLLQAQVPKRLHAGPMSEGEMEKIRVLLEQGTPADDSIQQAWGIATAPT